MRLQEVLGRRVPSHFEEYLFRQDEPSETSRLSIKKKPILSGLGKYKSAIWYGMLYFHCVMEKIGSEPRADVIRQRNVVELVDCILYRKDSELAYYFMRLHGDELGELSRAKLVQTMVDDPNDRGAEMAFRLLRDQPTLDSEARDSLLRRIVMSGDKTTCDLTLRFIPRLGIWERELRDVLSS